MLVGELTRWASLYSVCGLKTAQMNVRCWLIWELTFYEFKPGYNAAEEMKIICCAKYEDTVDHRCVTRWFNKLLFLPDRLWPREVDLVQIQSVSQIDLCKNYSFDRTLCKKTLKNERYSLISKHKITQDELTCR